ncbi:DUF1444 domain-containing protein [Anaerobacillus sp. MEB173]|uniref:DUF1444 domain-containing protein n=1 Tax=Anaerobacillus sp. MEB173 TaxID=3383345 RepID=UPI003F8E7685
MKINQLKKELEQRLASADRVITYNKENEELRIENSKTKKGVSISLGKLLAKWEKRKEAAIDETIHYVDTSLQLMNKRLNLAGKEKEIFPVIRSTSFPLETADGKKLVYDEHTAETRIFYSVDLGKSYALLDEETLAGEKVSADKIKELARFNVRSLPTEMKTDKVAGNTFYFINYNDGYDASRIVNDTLIEQMTNKVEGKLAIAVPHQDVLIFADIVNEQGYDVLAQMVFQFFMNGRVPVTALPFLYENGEFEPIFILAQKKPKQ